MLVAFASSVDRASVHSLIWDSKVQPLKPWNCQAEFLWAENPGENLQDCLCLLMEGIFEVKATAGDTHPAEEDSTTNSLISPNTCLLSPHAQWACQAHTLLHHPNSNRNRFPLQGYWLLHFSHLGPVRGTVPRPLPQHPGAFSTLSPNGAAVQAAILSGDTSAKTQDLLLDTTPLSLGTYSSFPSMPSLTSSSRLNQIKQLPSTRNPRICTYHLLMYRTLAKHRLY